MKKTLIKTLSAIVIADRTDWIAFEKSEKKLADSVFKILIEHAKNQGHYVKSNRIEFVDGKPRIQIEGGYIYVGDNLAIIEELD